MRPPPFLKLDEWQWPQTVDVLRDCLGGPRLSDYGEHDQEPT